MPQDNPVAGKVKHSQKVFSMALLAGNPRLDRRQDPMAELAEKRRSKSIHKSAKRFMNESPKYK